MIFFEEGELQNKIYDCRGHSVNVALNQINWNQNDNILSLACGDGFYEITIAESFKVNSIIGYDINDESLNRARFKAESKNLHNVKFFKRDISSINLDNYPEITKLICFGFSCNPLGLLSTLLKKEDLFNFLQRGGKFYVLPAECGNFVKKSSTNDKVYFFEKTQVESVSNYMSYLSNIFETVVYNNNIIEIRRCLLENDVLKDFLPRVRSNDSCLLYDSFDSI